MTDTLDVTVTALCRPRLERALESFLANVSCGSPFRFVVNIDAADISYLSAMRRWLAEKGINDISVRSVPQPSTQNRALAIESLLPRVRSPFYFHFGDNWEFTTPVDLDPLLALMERSERVDQIRFSGERIKPKAWLSYISDEIRGEFIKDNVQSDIDGVALVKSFGWSFGPSLNRTAVGQGFAGMGDEPMSPETVCGRVYEARAPYRGTYIYGSIGDAPCVRDTAVNPFLKKIRKAVYVLSGKKYAEYIF